MSEQKAEAAKQAAQSIGAGIAEGMRKAAETARLEAMVVAVVGSPELMTIAGQFAERGLNAALCGEEGEIKASAMSDPLSWRANALLQNTVAIAFFLRQKVEAQAKAPKSPLEAWQPPEGAAQ